MKLLKRITALMAALLIAVNITVVNVFAVPAAPVVGAGLEELLAELLLASGHSQSEIDKMSVTEMQDVVSTEIDNGTINSNTVIKHPVLDTEVTLLDYFSKYSGESKAAADIYAVAVKNWINDIISDDVALNDCVISTSNVHLVDGYGAAVVMPDGTVDYCQYVVRKFDDSNGQITEYGPRKRVYSYGSSSTSNSQVTFGDNTASWQYYGDVRWDDGTEAETDDVFEYPLGEVDGVTVTPDMLNPDGTVTIDGVTYNPADYLNPDNLTEEGKKQLVNNISMVINNTFVISQDKPVVDAGSIDVSLPAELEDFKISSAIANVFPFCLPFDFVRCMKLFSAKPVTPHFEVTIDVPAVLNVPPQKWTLEIDLGQFETLAKITRWLSLISFSYLLIILSTKIVKGAGA